MVTEATPHYLFGLVTYHGQAASALAPMIKMQRWLQLTSPVQWQLTLETLIGKGLGRSIEIGPNKVIAGIMKRISKDHEISNVFA